MISAYRSIWVNQMGRYGSLWNRIRENDTNSFKLTFDEMEKSAVLSIEHSFLN